MKPLPSLFVSHGSPMLAIEDSPARRFLMAWSCRVPRPQAILVVSAHWQGRGGPEVSFATKPMTIHDFGGFPRDLYEIHYPASGAPEQAEQAAQLLVDSGFRVGYNAKRGLDHGAWVPLSLMYPKADVPVFQVSLIRNAGPEEHYRLGTALGALRKQGVLIIGSGALTHNIQGFADQRPFDPAPLWVTGFVDWMVNTLASGSNIDLMDYRDRAPFAERNHPTEEHLMPLFVALGAGGDFPLVDRVHSSNSYGILAMDAFSFTGRVAVTDRGALGSASTSLCL